jgi:hypothetical protein
MQHKGKNKKTSSDIDEGSTMELVDKGANNDGLAKNSTEGNQPTHFSCRCQIIGVIVAIVAVVSIVGIIGVSVYFALATSGKYKLLFNKNVISFVFSEFL